MTLYEVAEKLYWFGFLCGDGTTNYKNNKIGFSLQESDKKSVESFADAVGYKGEIKHLCYYNKRTGKMSKCYGIRFMSKQMATDLKDLGKFGSKDSIKLLPPIIIELIKNAKELAGDGWMDTNAGRLALLFLFGFYDADGTLKAKRYFTIYQGGKNGAGIQFLEQVKEAFDVPNKVSGENSGSLPLGTVLRDAMMRAIWRLEFETMDRKHPVP